MIFKQLFKLYSSDYSEDYNKILGLIKQGIYIKSLGEINFVNDLANVHTKITTKLFYLGYFRKDCIDLFADDEVILQVYLNNKITNSYRGLVKYINFSKINNFDLVFIKLIKTGPERKKLIGLLEDQSPNQVLELMSQVLYDKLHQVINRKNNHLDHSFSENFESCLDYFAKTNNKFCTKNLSKFQTTKNLDYFLVVVAYFLLSFEVNQHSHPNNSEILEKIKVNINMKSPIINKITQTSVSEMVRGIQTLNDLKLS